VRQRRHKAGIVALAVACTVLAGLVALLLVTAPAATTAAQPSPMAEVEPASLAASPTSAPPPARPPPPPEPAVDVAQAQADDPQTDDPPEVTRPPDPAVDVAQAQTDDPQTDDPPETSPDSPPRSVALTERVVAARLATRTAEIKAECAVPWIVLDLAIERGQATLGRINGLRFTEADPIHSCVRTQLHGLRFPRANTRAEFSLTIDLSKDPR